MVKFASPEYLEEMKKRTNSDPKYQELAKNESGSYTMILQAEPENGVPNTIVVGYREENGKIVETWVGERPTDFVISGKYGVWVDILNGKMGPTKAFVMRKLKVKGDFLKIVQGSAATDRWIQILRTIPTEFEGKYAQYNIKGEP